MDSLGQSHNDGRLVQYPTVHVVNRCGRRGGQQIQQCLYQLPLLSYFLVRIHNTNEKLLGR